MPEEGFLKLITLFKDLRIGMKMQCMPKEIDFQRHS